VELARLSSKPLGEVAGVSPGTVISSIQVRQALQDDVLVPWKKAVPEDFKTMTDLVRTDRGGLSYQPRTGFHEDVVEVDFSSLYPNIIATRNVSPETLDCDCCSRDEARQVPQLNYSTCTKRDGFLPRVLRPIIARRDDVKNLIREGVEEEFNTRRSNALKWILITCFGYTGYKNAKFGKIECHEAICAHGRHILTRATELAEKHGYQVLHGLVDSLWLKGTGDLDAFLQEATEETGVRLEFEKRFKWIVFLPRRNSRTGALNRYYGVDTDGNLKVRGVEARQSNSPRIVKEFQREVLQLLAEASNEDEFYVFLEDAEDLLGQYMNDLRSGDVSSEDLAITSSVSKRLEDYTQYNFNAAALQRYKDLGIEKKPGEKVQYVVKNTDSKKKDRVALIEEEPEEFDSAYYRGQLEKALESLEP